MGLGMLSMSEKAAKIDKNLASNELLDSNKGLPYLYGSLKTQFRVKNVLGVIKWFLTRPCVLSFSLMSWKNTL